MSSNIIVGDADVLVAFYYKADILHNRAINTSKKLIKKGVPVVFPNTAIAEAITTLHRKLSNSTAADLLNKHYKKGGFEVEYISEETMQQAAKLYNPQGSKQNTFFDALVAATAKKLSSNVIFSFDKWYEKQGFKLASNLE